MTSNSRMDALATNPKHALASSIPRQLASRLLWLPDSARSMGIHIMAGKGSGKSRLMGRLIAWLDFLRGIPLVIFDPHGPTIDNFLDKITRLPRAAQESLWPRVFYVDMSGRGGHVVPFPLYYRLGNESLYEISQRYLDVVRKIDPFLQTASVEGWNPLWRTGTYAGMVLAALNFQISEAQSLLTKPHAWEGLLLHALTVHPEIHPAADFFRALAEEKQSSRSRHVDSLLTKVAIFNLDPTMRAMFGASTPGIEWSNVVERRLAVLLDFRHEHDIERRRFKMLWGFTYFLDFVKNRGAGRHRPVSLIVDELTSLLSVHGLAVDLFAAELDELINVIARNYGLWLTIAHQELFQLSERAQKTLMAMGTQMLGVTSDAAAAVTLAQQFFRYDPHWVKKYEPVYFGSQGVASIIDYRSVEYTVEEQFLLRSYDIRHQGRFHFLVRPALGEGETRGGLRPVSLAAFDTNRYPDEELVATARQLLVSRRGRRVGDVLAEIAARLEPFHNKGQLPNRASSEELEEDTLPLWGA